MMRRRTLQRSFGCLMECINTEIPDVKIIRPRRFRDHRGFFSETYSSKALSAFGIDTDFVQDNHSLSVDPLVLRGLHFQTPPFAQTKLVRVVRGSIHDVVVDIRRGSPWYGRHVGITLSADSWEQLLVPEGFAHGFCTLDPNTEVLYKVSADYAPAHDKGLLWNDPALGIEWPLGGAAPVLSDKDKFHPRLAELPGYFVYHVPARHEMAG